jgi:ATP/maltotriose-dependent transcriptional regulator MalT
MAPSAAHLVGRADEIAALEQILDGLDGGRPRAVELAGEAGIGKTRVLQELATRAEARGHLVLSGSASELERDLPFSVFVDALDSYVAGLEPVKLAAFDEQVVAELAHIFPSLTKLAGRREVALQDERYRSHRAVRALLERLAEPSPMILILDDFHWADAGSVELLGALFRRPPAAAVLSVVSHRSRQVPDRFEVAMERTHRSGTLTRFELGALTLDEAGELLGSGFKPSDAATLYAESGGNPFYLEQLARSFRAGHFRPASPHPGVDIGVPSAVAASLREELAMLSGTARRVFEGASVAGDPFEPEVAAAAAGTSEASAMDAIDELLRLDLIRTTDAPRRFRFRHPLVWRAVYEETAPAWRVGAHERSAAILASQGAASSVRAPHVERSARRGDTSAIATLRQAGDAAARLAPNSAAHWFGAALRLLPRAAPVLERLDLLIARARALAAAGQFAESHEAMLEAVEIVPRQESGLRTMVVTMCAGVERFMGRYEQAHARLLDALRVLPDTASVDRIELLMELTVNEFYRSRYKAMRVWAVPALAAAREVGDPVLIAAASAMPALADAMSGPVQSARNLQAEAARLVDGLTDDELSARPDAAGWLAAAEMYLDLYAEAEVHASRALRLARSAARGGPLHRRERLYPILPRVWYVRGKLAEATVLLDDVVDAARLLGSPPVLAGNLFNRSAVAIAVGDMDVALATAEEGAELTRGLDTGFVSAWAAARLAAVLLEIGQADRAAELLVSQAGGEGLTLIPRGWKAYFLELLTRCWLALDRADDAERAAGLARDTAAGVQLPLARAWADRASAAVALQRGDAAYAIERSLASAKGARQAGAPIEEALSRTVAGRALALAGRNESAVAELTHAAQAFEACGAMRFRDSAERELGKLGHRPHRRTRRGAATGRGIASLTEREHEVAQLVVDRKTNAEIAAELFLSQKTVETHLRNIFNKMGVTGRVALSRAFERSERTPQP